MLHFSELDIKTWHMVNQGVLQAISDFCINVVEKYVGFVWNIFG